MLRTSSIMVLFSYLLLGHAARASLEDVLAPVEATTTGTAAPVESTVIVTDAREESARTPLVKPGVDELDLLAELESQLTAKLEPAGRLRLIPVSALPRLPRTANLPQVILLDHPSRLTSSSALVRFRLQDGERTFGTYAVTFRVQVLAQAWMPARRLTAGDPLFGEDVEAREVDLVREPKAVPADPEIFGKYELARSVTPERTLVWTDLVPRALVRKGQLVDVVARDGILSITMKGQATRSGALGEVVTIRNLESKREFAAEVVDENKVRVHF